MPPEPTTDGRIVFLNRSLSFRFTLRLTTAVSLFCTLAIWGSPSPVSAAITLSGTSTTPTYNGSDPWNIQGDLTVGGFTFPGGNPGLLTIDGGSIINNASGFVGGTSSFASAVVTVTGNGSQWNNSDELNIGTFFGFGELNIEDQAVVSVGQSTVVGSSSTTRVINFDGGTLSTGHLAASPQELLGTGTINTATILSDIDLVFDQTHGLQQQYTLNNEPGQSVSINIDASNAPGNLVTGAGYRSTGSLTITDSISLASHEGVLGYHAGSQGSATVSGSGSQWDILETLYLGYAGTGSLAIEDTAVVNVDLDTIAGHSGSASGSIAFDGGTLNTGGLVASADSMTGTGTINTHTLVSDIDLVIDTLSGLQQQVILATMSGQNITINLDLSDPGSNRSLGVGYSGNGTLTLLDGLSVSSTQGILGYQGGSSGVASVSGAGTHWINSDTLTVGDYGTGSLNIVGGGLVDNMDGFVGKQAGSDGTLSVSDQDSQWISDGDAYIGYRGTGELNIDNGGFVQSDTGQLGYHIASNGTASISGTDSIWRIKQGLSVGRNGMGELTVQGGGHLLVDYYTPYTHSTEIGEDAGSSGTVTVTGPGSLAEFRYLLNVGSEGTGALVVSDGGVVTSHTGTIGKESGAEGTATLTGAGSQWDTNSGLYVGRAGTGTLSILDGAAINTSSFPGFAASIGSETGAVGLVTIDGAGSQWNIDGPFYVAEEGSGTLQLNNGGSVNVTGSTFIEGTTSANGSIEFSNGSLNTLNLFSAPANMLGTGTISAQGVVSDFDIQFDQASGLQPQILLNNLVNQNVTVNIDTSDTSVNNILGAGFRGFGNLSISQGISVSSAKGVLGYNTGSQGTATVTGAGSEWITRDELIVGQDGLGRLNISDGGKVIPDEFYIGDGPFAYGIVDVIDSGSFLEVKDAYVGRHGSGSLTIRDGALGGRPGHNYSLYLASEPGSHGSVEVTDSGSSWQGGTIHVGSKGVGSLDVVQGGNIQLTGSLNIGSHDSSYGEVNISGSGTTVSTGSYVFVGNGGTGLINIEDAGVLDSRQARIGRNSESIGIATVTDPGSRWDIVGYSYIGEEGSGTLNILNGAHVNNLSDGYQTEIGHDTGSIGRVNVSGTGSLWELQGYLTVGNLGNGRLHIEDNATVNVAYDTRVRKDPAKTGSIHFNNGTLNTAGLITAANDLLGTGTINTGTILSDVDLVFDQNSGLQQQVILNALTDQNVTLNVNPGADPPSNRTMGLGYSGSGSMTLADGLSLSSVSGILGYYPGSTGTATITGNGTEWINNELLIGRGGEGTLTILDGAHVQSDKAYLGFESGSMGAVIVSGAGSTLDITSSSFYVAFDGSGSLTINDGGQVNSGVSIILGDGSATVSGIGSRWDADILGVGHDGDSSLLIEDGGVLSTIEPSTINGSPGTQAWVTVTGNGSKWEADDGLTIGHATGHKGTLNILSGGAVEVQHFRDQYTFLGLEEDAEGILNVNGTGSVLDIDSSLNVGYRGTGILNIQNGALVNVEQHVWGGSQTGGTGEMNFDNGTLNTGSLNFNSANILGTGTINTKTLLSDVDLRFDATHGLQQQILLNSEPNQNVTINIDYTEPTSNLLAGAGYRGIGSLTVAEGQSITSIEGVLGYHVGAHGTATIDGVGSSWLNTGDLRVGNYGTGVLSILNGGYASSADLYLGYESYSDGSIMIDGVGSQLETGLLTLGFRRSTGTVSVTNGGRLTTASGRIGFVRNSMMDVTVSDPGSLWQTDGLLVGNEGAASLTIRNSGRVTSDGDVSIAHQQISTGEVTVTDPGSRISINGTMTIRGNSSNALTISNGGIVESMAANVGGYNTSGNTVINIGGPGSQWLIDGALGIGVSGNAELNIQEGGLVDTHEMSLAATQNTRGIINQTGGTVRLNTGDLQLANGNRSNATYNLNGGVLDLQGNNITFGIGDTHQFNFGGGVLKNAGSISAGSAFVQEGGTLAPGGSIGQTDIIGGYTLTAGTVEIEFGGIGNPHDVLTATGDIDIALLGTTLDLPALGAMSAGMYTLIESTSGVITGTFENITGLGIYVGLIDVQYTTNAVNITLNWDYLPGDLDGDGFVGINDLNTVLVAWNQNVTPGDLTSGDVTGDGYVGIGDLTAVLANWNTGTPPTAISNIPEPASVVLLSMCTLGMVRHRIS